MAGKQTDVSPRRGREGTTLDSEQREVRREQFVKVIDGPHKVRTYGIQIYLRTSNGLSSHIFEQNMDYIELSTIAINLTLFSLLEC